MVRATVRMAAFRNRPPEARHDHQKIRNVPRRTILRGAARRGDRAPLAGGDGARGARKRRRRRSKRFIVMFSPNGTLPSAWTPTRRTDEIDFTLSPILAPLAPHKADLVVDQRAWTSRAAAATGTRTASAAC